VPGVVQPDLHPSTARVLAGVWAFRARSEREAVARFTRLARQLAEQGALPELVSLAARAVDDERRHVDLCLRMAARYGHAPADDAEPPAAHEIGPASLAPADRLLYELVAFCAITESLNTALMTVTYEHARDPVARAAVREILADEVHHGRLGWAHLAACRARGQGDFIPALLPAMLAGAASEGLFDALDERDRDPALLDHGELPLATRTQIFVRTLEDVVFPGLERHRLPTAAGRRWLQGRS
jgi:hypothetical protein